MHKTMMIITITTNIDTDKDKALDMKIWDQ